VRAGHGGSADGSVANIRSDPGSGNVLSGGKDVGALSPVAEGGSGVIDVDGVDGDSGGNASRRVVAGISVVVSRGDDDDESHLDGLSDGIIKGLGGSSSEGHVGNGPLSGAAGVPVGGELNSTGNVQKVSSSEASEGFDGDEVGVLGNSVSFASGSGSAVGSVSVVVGGVIIIVVEIVSRNSASLEFLVGEEDSSVDNVEIDSLASVVKVFVVGVEGEVGLVDAIEPPGSVVLGFELGVDDLVGFDVLDDVVEGAEFLNSTKEEREIKCEEGFKKKKKKKRKKGN